MGAARPPILVQLRRFSFRLGCWLVHRSENSLGNFSVSRLVRRRASCSSFRRYHRPLTLCCLWSANRPQRYREKARAKGNGRLTRNENFLVLLIFGCHLLLGSVVSSLLRILGLQCQPLGNSTFASVFRCGWRPCADLYRAGLRCLFAYAVCRDARHGPLRHCTPTILTEGGAQ